MKTEDLGRLNNYGWIDRKAGVAHIPIDRAIDILAKKGLPTPEERGVKPGEPARSDGGCGTQRASRKPGRTGSPSDEYPDCGSVQLFRSASDRLASLIAVAALPSRRWCSWRCRRHRRSRRPRGGSDRPRSGLTRSSGARLPLEARFRDESGRELPLGELFGRRPVILAPVYYGCPLLCGQVLAGLARGLKPLSLEAGKDFDVVAFSINPDETPALAASKRTAYLERYDRPGSESGWHFLTGERGFDRGAVAVRSVFATPAIRRPSFIRMPRGWSS